MNIQSIAIGMAMLGGLTSHSYAQTTADSTAKPAVKKYQARAQNPALWSPSLRAIQANGDPVAGFCWFFVNFRGTTFMVDPVLEGFDMPVPIDFPIAPKAVYARGI